MPVGRNNTLPRTKDSGPADAGANITTWMCEIGCISLPCCGIAIPGRFPDDDAPVIFHIEPFGKGSGGAAVPKRNAVHVIDDEVAIGLEVCIGAGVATSARPPRACTVGPVI